MIFNKYSLKGHIRYTLMHPEKGKVRINPAPTFSDLSVPRKQLFYKNCWSKNNKTC